MARYTKRPVVKRFRRQVTKRGRDIRKAVLERKERKRPLKAERKMRPKRALIR